MAWCGVFGRWVCGVGVWEPRSRSRSVILVRVRWLCLAGTVETSDVLDDNYSLIFFILLGLACSRILKSIRLVLPNVCFTKRRIRLDMLLADRGYIRTAANSRVKPFGPSPRPYRLLCPMVDGVPDAYGSCHEAQLRVSSFLKSFAT